MKDTIYIPRSSYIPLNPRPCEVSNKLHLMGCNLYISWVGYIELGVIFIEISQNLRPCKITIQIIVLYGEPIGTISVRMYNKFVRHHNCIHPPG